MNDDKFISWLELLAHYHIDKLIYYYYYYCYLSSGSSTPRFDDLRKTTPRYDESGRGTPRSNSSLSTYGIGNRQPVSGRLLYGLSSSNKSPRSSGSGRESMRSTPRTNTSPHSMVESSLSGDATPLYDENWEYCCITNRTGMLVILWVFLLIVEINYFIQCFFSIDTEDL